MEENLVSLSDVIGYRDIKDLFLNSYQDNVKLFLFIGAIHNGKHYLTKALSNSLDLPLYMINKDDMGEKDEEKRDKLHQIMEMLKKNKRGIVLFESSEYIFKENKCSDELIDDFLTSLDELDQDDYKIRIILNAEVPSYIHKRLIDDAYVCRFTLPEVFERKALIKRLVSDEFYKQNEEILEFIAKESNYYAYGELKRYINKLISLNCKLTIDNINFKKADIKLFDEYGYEFIEDYCSN